MRLLLLLALSWGLLRGWRRLLTLLLPVALHCLKIFRNMLARTIGIS